MPFGKHRRESDCARHLAANRNDQPQLRKAFAQRDDVARRRTILRSRQRNRGLAAAVSDQMLELENAIGCVHRLHDGAQRIDGKPSDQKLGQVRQVHDHHVAALDAGTGEPGSETRHVGAEYLVGQRPVAGEDRGAIGRGGRAAVDPIAKRFVAPPALVTEIRWIENCHRRPQTARRLLASGFNGPPAPVTRDRIIQ